MVLAVEPYLTLVVAVVNVPVPSPANANTREGVAIINPKLTMRIGVKMAKICLVQPRVLRTIPRGSIPIRVHSLCANRRLSQRRAHRNPTYGKDVNGALVFVVLSTITHVFAHQIHMNGSLTCQPAARASVCVTAGNQEDHGSVTQSFKDNTQLGITRSVVGIKNAQLHILLPPRLLVHNEWFEPHDRRLQSFICEEHRPRCQPPNLGRQKNRLGPDHRGISSMPLLDLTAQLGNPLQIVVVP
jgi:hypothetical protein